MTRGKSAMKNSPESVMHVAQRSLCLEKQALKYHAAMLSARWGGGPVVVFSIALNLPIFVGLLNITLGRQKNGWRSGNVKAARAITQTVLKR